jgi:hypothetical protein
VTRPSVPMRIVGAVQFTVQSGNTLFAWTRDSQGACYEIRDGTMSRKGESCVIEDDATVLSAGRYAGSAANQCLVQLRHSVHERKRVPHSGSGPCHSGQRTYPYGSDVAVRCHVVPMGWG